MKTTFNKEDSFLVKGIAICLMLFYHLFENEVMLKYLGEKGLEVIHKPFSQNTFLTMSGFGNVCVAIFAFISAYGISKKLNEKDGGTISLKEMYSYSVKRCGKLLLNFFVMYLSVICVFGYFLNFKDTYGSGWQGLWLAILDACSISQFIETPTIDPTWWYMKLAILIIFITPLLYKAVKKFGNYLIPLGIVLLFSINWAEDVKRYLFVVIVGVVAANEDWFERLLQIKGRLLLKAVIGIAAIAGFVAFRQNHMVQTYLLWFVDAVIALFICWFGMEIVGRIPGISKGFSFLGKHSMNIYFVHSFFYMFLFQDYIYRFHYAFVTFLILLAISLLYSVLLEYVKKGVALIIRKKRNMSV